MSIVRPFRAVRPESKYVEDIAALPYDVYSSEEAREVVKDKPLSFLKIDRAEVFFNEQVDIHSEEVYQKAHDVLYEMLEKGQFIQDDKSMLYLYELTMDGRSQIGLVSCTSVDEYQNDMIKKHEKTRADKEADRINHVNYCDANTGPIFLTYKAKPTINELVDNWISHTDVLYDYIADDGIGHRIWQVDDEKVIKALEDAFSQVEALYIADGHHRAASAVKVATMRRAEFPSYTGEEEFNFFLSVAFPDEQLYIMDYNRVVKDLNGLDKEEYLNSILDKFEVIRESNEPIKSEKKRNFTMYLDAKWYLLQAKEGTYDETDPVSSLDVSILQNNLLTPILGIGDPRVDKRIDFVGGIRGLKALERRANSDMMIAFALYPTSINELIDIADAGALMPPKSTWFEPKLRSGLFIHLLK